MSLIIRTVKASNLTHIITSNKCTAFTIDVDIRKQTFKMYPTTKQIKTIEDANELQDALATAKTMVTFPEDWM